MTVPAPRVPPRALTARTLALLIAIGLCLAFPSSAKVQRYLGMAWVLPYVVGALAGVIVGWRFLAPVFLGKLTTKASLVLFALTFAAMAAAFVVVYPLANSGRFGGGSDRDEALNAGVDEMLHGRYPYYVLSTQPGRPDEAGPLSPMPGALFFSAPFVLAGNSAYQNFLWIAVFFAVMAHFLRDARRALLLLGAVLLLAPVCMQEVVTGGDQMANAIWVFTFTVMVWSAVPDPSVPPWRKTLWCILFGLGLSSRVNYAVVGPLLFAALVQTAGWRTALKYMSIAAAACLAVTLPFYLYDPAGFTPFWLLRSRMEQYATIAPAARWVVPLVGGLLTTGLCFTRADRRGAALFRNCAVVLAWFVLAEVVLSSLRAGRPDLDRRALHEAGRRREGGLDLPVARDRHLTERALNETRR